MEKFKKGILNEGHARELLQCSNFELPPWLSRETVMLEVLETALRQHKKKLIAKHIAALVERRSKTDSTGVP